MNITNKHYKIYRVLSLACVLALSLGVTMIALAGTSPTGATKTTDQTSYRLDNILARPAESSIGTCMVDRFNVMNHAKKTSLECTSNDVQLASYELISGPDSCTLGETINVVIYGEFIATSNERWDVGVFISTDTGTPNASGGTCYNDFLHYASLTNTDLNLIDGSGPFYNGELAGGGSQDLNDTCGDIQQNVPTYLTTQTIPIICQDSDNNGVADVQSCTVWDNS